MAAGAWILWSRWYWRCYLPAVTVLAAIVLPLACYSIPTDYAGNSELQSLKFALNVVLVTHLLFGLPFFRAFIVNLACATVYVTATVLAGPPTEEDTQGHQAGDACLRQIAAILKTHARRPLDLAARYGGEEFAVILYQMSADQIRAIAEAIRLTVEAAGIPNPAAPRKIVTISCGMAVVTPEAGRSMHGLVQCADEALYEAKANGRNCAHRANQDYSTLQTGSFRRRHLRAVS